MITRHLSPLLQKLATQYPIVTLTGPRQSGKTTLAKSCFEHYRYVSLEDPDQHQWALDDPRDFLETYKDQVIIDEVQNAPDLFSYLQSHVDRTNKLGQYILTGSQQFLLNQRISQTLAGRAGILKLLPFNLSELLKQPACSLEDDVLNPIKTPPEFLLKTLLLQGMYPRVHEHQLDPSIFYKNYTETYVTRDLQSLTQVGDLLLFRKFLRILAGRSGQILNLSQIGNDVGVAHNTISRWVSILEAGYLIHLIGPYYNNYNKRLIKSPKLYFLDTGLLCYLLGIENTQQLSLHPLVGSIFETFVFTEILKMRTHQGKEPKIYFWRDQSGHEVDFIADWERLTPIEVKLGQTITADQLKPLLQWITLTQQTRQNNFLIYGGNELKKQKNINILPWFYV